MGMVTPFGWQHSLGLDLAGGEELSRSFEPCLNVVYFVCGPDKPSLSYRSSNKPPDAQAEEDNDSHSQSQHWQRIAMQTWCHHTSQPFG